MKAVFQREGLQQAAGLLAGAVSTKDVKPVLQCIKVVAGQDSCTLEATNMELSVQTELKGVKIEMSGEVLIPLSRLAAILREVTQEEITIEADTERVTVFAGFAEFEMPTYPTKEFPAIASVDDAGCHMMKADVLRQMIARVHFAAASENPRYAMNGVLIEIQKGCTQLIATDGRRLAVCRGESISNGAKDTALQPHVVPRPTIALIQRTLSDPDEEVQLRLTSNAILISTPRAKIHSLLVEGRFPTWREVLPKKTSTTVKVGAGALLSAVRQASVMNDGETKAVAFTFDKNRCVIEGKGGDQTGRSKVVLEVEQEGKNISVRYDTNFLTPMLKVVEADSTVEMNLEPQMPGLLKCGPDYDYVVMPMV